MCVNLWIKHVSQMINCQGIKKPPKNISGLRPKQPYYYFLCRKVVWSYFLSPN